MSLNIILHPWTKLSAMCSLAASVANSLMSHHNHKTSAETWHVVRHKSLSHSYCLPCTGVTHRRTSLSCTLTGSLLLQSNEPHNSEVMKVELMGIQRMLGIRSGGPDALVALSLLCGGDYAVRGAEHVGSRQAIRLLQHLLQDCQVCM